MESDVLRPDWLPLGSGNASSSVKAPVTWKAHYVIKTVLYKIVARTKKMEIQSPEILPHQNPETPYGQEENKAVVYP